MSRQTILIYALISILLLSGCSDDQVDLTITPDQVLDLMAEGEAILVDVRTPEEYAGGHIEGAINIPLTQIQEDKALPYDKEEQIILYCRSGNRSGTAANILVEAGYTKINDLGGINDWPYEVVK